MLLDSLFNFNSNVDKIMLLMPSSSEILTLILKITPRGNHKWVDKHQPPKPKSQCVTAEILKDWVRHMTENLYMTAGDSIFQQVIGLPMGTNSAPYLANIMLFMFEYKFIKSQIAKYLQHQSTDGFNTLLQLSFCTRYIDDLWNPAVPPTIFNELWPQIYPDYLTLNLEMEQAKVNYLDMTIWYSERDKRWHSKLYDKRIELMKKGLKLNKFPQPGSCLTNQCKYRVITSQCARFLTANTRPKDFLHAATSLYSDYYHKPYDPRIMNKCFERFLRRNRHIMPIKPTAVQDRFNFLLQQQRLERKHRTYTDYCDQRLYKRFKMSLADDVPIPERIGPSSSQIP